MKVTATRIEEEEEEEEGLFNVSVVIFIGSSSMKCQNNKCNN